MVTTLLVCLLDRCKLEETRAPVARPDWTPSLRGTCAPTPTLRGSFLVSLLKIDGADLSRCPGYFLIHLSSFLSYFLSRMCVFSVVGIEMLLYHSPLYLLRQELLLSWCWAIPGRLASQHPGGLHLHLLSTRIKGGPPHLSLASTWMPFQSLCINFKQFVNGSILPPHGFIFEAIA